MTQEETAEVVGVSTDTVYRKTPQNITGDIFHKPVVDVQGLTANAKSKSNVMK